MTEEKLPPPVDRRLACAYCDAMADRPQGEPVPAGWLLVWWDGYRAACGDCVERKRPPRRQVPRKPRAR